MTFENADQKMTSDREANLLKYTTICFSLQCLESLFILHFVFFAVSLDILKM